MDQHGTEDQTHGRAGGVRDAQTGAGDRPMIHHRRTIQIAPGRQADAVALGKEAGAYWKEATGIDVRVSVVTTGHLGRICLSGEYESMGAFEDAMVKARAFPAFKTLWANENAWQRDGTHPWHHSTAHDEYWRDA